MGAGASTVKKARKDPDGDEAGILFKKLDADENGFVTVVEVTKMMKKSFPDWKVADIQRTIDRFDADGDKKINRQEFGEALRAMEDNPEAKARVKPGEAPKRAWTFKNPIPMPRLSSRKSSELVKTPDVSLSPEELAETERKLLEAQKVRMAEAEKTKQADEEAKAKAAAPKEETAEERSMRLKVEAKMKEAEAALAKKKEDEKASAEMAAAAAAQSEESVKRAAADKEAARAAAAQKHIDDEKAKKAPALEQKAKEEAAKKAQEEAADKERREKIKADDAALAEQIKAEENKAAARADAKKLTDEMTGKAY